MRIIFMGSPDFAVESLKAITEAKFDVVAAVTQPDKPKGRGYALFPTAVGEFCELNNIPVYKPQTLKNGELQPILDEYKPDCIVVAAYGKILPEYVLNYPKYGCVNVHASLLPMYRGASPINFAIINGEKKTGITTMLMDKGLDTGDMLMSAETEILPSDDAETLHDRLALMGGKLIVKTLSELENGNIKPIKQEGETCYAPLITNEIKKIDFTKSADEIVNRVRGLSPVPCAFALSGGKTVKIYQTQKVEKPCDGTLTVKVADGYVRILSLAPEGKKRMSDEEFMRGHKDFSFD